LNTFSACCLFDIRSNLPISSSANSTNSFILESEKVRLEILPLVI
jgi:hypothetical protein